MKIPGSKHAATNQANKVRMDGIRWLTLLTTPRTFRSMVDRAILSRCVGDRQY